MLTEGKANRKQTHPSPGERIDGGPTPVAAAVAGRGFLFEKVGASVIVCACLVLLLPVVALCLVCRLIRWAFVESGVWDGYLRQKRAAEGSE